MSRLAPALVGLLALVLLPSAAYAYSAATTFALPALEGGGGGRHFTGSFADGYTCGVCHGDTSAEPPTIDGLPADGFVAGQTYELLVSWTADARRAGLALEIVDGQGAAAGTIALVGAGQTDELCRDDGSGMTPRAAIIVTPAPVGPGGPRSVLVVSACGASAARILWTAPPTSRGSAFLEASYVRSDGTGGPEGDTTAHVELQIPPLNVPADARLLDGGCSLASPREPPGESRVALPLVSVVALLLLRRRRRQRR